MCGHRKRVCTESWLWEKNPLPHQRIEPAPAPCRSDALTTELYPHPNFYYVQPVACFFLFIFFLSKVSVNQSNPEPFDSLFSSRWHRRSQEGCIRPIPCRRRFLGVAFKTILFLVWLTVELSRSFNEDHRTLSLSTPLSFSRSIVWCSWLCVRRLRFKFLNTSDLTRLKLAVMAALPASLKLLNTSDLTRLKLLSRPFSEDHRTLPFSTPLSFKRSSVWCSWLRIHRFCFKRLNASDLQRLKLLVMVALPASLKLLNTSDLPRLKLLVTAALPANLKLLSASDLTRLKLLSRPFNIDHPALPPLTPLSFRRSIVWCSWLRVHRLCFKLLNASDLTRLELLVTVALPATLSA